MIRRFVSALMLLAAMGWGVAQADVITLDAWNVDEINASGDYVSVDIGADGTILTVRWIEGATSGDLWTPEALDKFYLNSAVAISGVYVGSTSGTNLLGSAWSLEPSCTGCNNVADFGQFLNFTASPGNSNGTAWAVSDTLIFVMSSSVNWGPNSAGNTFAAHLRYGNDCSGWVGDGGPRSGSSSSDDCSRQVPEPATLALFGLGLIGLGLGRRRKN